MSSKFDKNWNYITSNFQEKKWLEVLHFIDLFLFFLEITSLSK